MRIVCNNESSTGGSPRKGKGNRMATMIERQAASVQKELDKLNARLAREQAKLVKKTAAAEKIGATCTREEWFAGMREAYTDEQRWAFTEKWSAERDVEDTERQIANAEKRLAKLTGKVDAQQEANAKETAEVERIGKIEIKMLSEEEREANAARRKEEYEKWLAEFKAECLKDGIIIDEACGRWFSGTAANGKRFHLDGNSGWTTRSRHCYTLTMNGVTVFTSGEFLTAYRYLMKK